MVIIRGIKQNNEDLQSLKETLIKKGIMTENDFKATKQELKEIKKKNENRNNHSTK